MIFRALFFGVVACVVARAAEPNAFLNLSARGVVQSGENVLIGGLVVETRSNVLIRAVGPTLASFGVAVPLARPRLTLYDKDDRPLATNEDWRLAIHSWTTNANGAAVLTQNFGVSDAPLDALRATMHDVGAFDLASFSDAALYVDLPPGLYTAQVSSATAGTGVALLEIYLVPSAIDPFVPAWRARQSPANNYTPARDGLAPTAVVDATNGSTLRLNFDAAVTWSFAGSSTSASRTAIEIAWRSTGRDELRLGLSGEPDSRGWLVSPRYTKTAANSASVVLLTTADAAGHAMREEVTLTFANLGSGTFTCRWGDDDAANDRLAQTRGQATGNFSWAKTPTTIDSATDASGLSFHRVFPHTSADGRPYAEWAMRVTDAGAVLRHGDGPGGCDINGAREPVVTDLGGGQFLMHYDGCAIGGWRACRAVSSDLVHWTKDGAVLAPGAPGSIDAGCACSPWIIEDGGTWHMFYLATPNQTPAPDFIPANPYRTRRATAPSALGPWTKQPAIVPFDLAAGTYYSDTASPGFVVRHGGEFLQFFSAAQWIAPSGPLLRTLGLARTTSLDAAWTIASQPLVPLEEQIENSGLYFEPANNLWFLFTNHVGLASNGGEYTDAVWVYWSADPTHFDARRKAIVMDADRSTWSKSAIGMPSVVRVGDRLALFYDGSSTADFGHMRRDIGLVWINLPLQPPDIATTP